MLSVENDDVDAGPGVGEKCRTCRDAKDPLEGLETKLYVPFAPVRFIVHSDNSHPIL